MPLLHVVGLGASVAVGIAVGSTELALLDVLGATLALGAAVTSIDGIALTCMLAGLEGALGGALALNGADAMVLTIGAAVLVAGAALVAGGAATLLAPGAALVALATLALGIPRGALLPAGCWSGELHESAPTLRRPDSTALTGLVGLSFGAIMRAS